jgi:hypothetical protein
VAKGIPIGLDKAVISQIQMDRSNADVTFLNSGYITLWFLILLHYSSTHPIISVATGVASFLEQVIVIAHSQSSNANTFDSIFP